MSKRKLWSYGAGTHPHTVRVLEREPGGVLCAILWDATAARRVKGKVLQGAQRWIALGHRDRDRAMLYAEETARRLRAGAQADGGLAWTVLALYEANHIPGKVERSQPEDLRRAELWRRFLGPEKLVSELGADDWHRFIRERNSGAIDARGEAVPEGKRKRVSPRTVDADLVFMNAALNWAVTWRIGGKPVIEKNPWAATTPGVKRALERPKTRAPKRPVATYDRYLALHAVADQVLMLARKGEPGARLVRRVGAKHGVRRNGRAKKRGKVLMWMRPSYFRDLLELSEQTGRRITALCRLQYDDPQMGVVAEEMPNGTVRRRRGVVALRWRPIKGEDEKVIPVSPETRATIERIQRERPGLGAAPMFPAPKHPRRPMSRHLADDWMREAETLARDADGKALVHLPGGCWHTFRRKWGTERKHLATKDVMEAGGWKDERSLKDSYQQVDTETLLAVVNEPRKLREREA